MLKIVQHKSYSNVEEDLVHSVAGHLLSMHKARSCIPNTKGKHWTKAEGSSDQSLLCLLTGTKLDSGDISTEK